VCSSDLIVILIIIKPEASAARRVFWIMSLTFFGGCRGLGLRVPLYRF